MCCGDNCGVWDCVRLRDQPLYLHAFGPGPWWVGVGESLPDEQTVWAVWADEAKRQAADASGIAVEIEKSIYSSGY